MSIAKVAKLAGVSTSTVSRVINQHPRVAPETAKAVKAAMDELAYTPSDRRPGPKPFGRKSATINIGFFVIGRSDDSASPGLFDLLRGVSKAASNHDHKLHFAYLPHGESLPGSISSQPLDGVLLHGLPPSEALQRQFEKLPTVWVMGNRLRPDTGDQVMPDSLEIGEMAADYLATAGGTNLVYVNMDASHWGLAAYGHSFMGAAKKLGITVKTVERIHQPSPDRPPGFERAAIESVCDEISKLSPRADSLFIADALQSAVLLPALARCGWANAAGKLHVITCNNETAYLAGLSPQPAVIDIEIESIGRQGVEQLIWRMNHRGAADRITTMIAPRLLLPDSFHAHATTG